MNEAQYALAGAAIGSIIPGFVAYWAAWREDRRAAADRQESRDARLFEYKNRAYAEFASAAQQLLNRLNEYHSGVVNMAPPDYDVTDHVIDLRGPVTLYAPADVDELAWQVIIALGEYAEGPVQYDAVAEKIKAFAAAARRDLGADDRRRT